MKGRKPKEEKSSSITVRIPEELKYQLKLKTTHDKKTLSEVILTMIKNYIKN